jgi:hypothetical protein
MCESVYPRRGREIHDELNTMEEEWIEDATF